MKTNPMNIACGVLLLASTTIADAQTATVLQQYELPSRSYVDLGYSQAQLDQAVADGLTAPDKPGLASGLQHLYGNRYLSVSDRGPNFTVPGKRVFPLPDFTPTIFLLRTEGTSIVPEYSLPIVANEQGDPVTGIPNSATEDSIPYRNAADATQLPFNPNGMDIEDVHTLGLSGFIVVDEYSPSIATVNLHGRVTRRYTPQGKTLPGASYPVSDTLPAVLSQRRANRGFESIAVSPSGRTAYTLTQSPLGSTSSGSPYVNSRVVRLLRLDTSDAQNIRVSGQFVLQLSLAATYPAGTRQRDLKISSAAWISPTKLLLLERSDEILNGVNNGGAKLLLVDLKDATDIHGTALADTLVPENAATDFAALGITPVATTVVYSNLETPEIQDFKLEGLAILNPWTVAISNDNDFGVGDFPGATSKIWHIRLGAPLPMW